MFQKCTIEEAPFEIAIHIQWCLESECFMLDDSPRSFDFRAVALVICRGILAFEVS